MWGDRDRHIPRAWAITLQQNLRSRLPELPLSLELGRFLSLDHLGFLGYALRSCATPLEALRLLARSSRLVDTAYRDADARVEERGDAILFCTRRVPNDPVESIEMAMVSTVHLLRQFTGVTVRPNNVRFAHSRGPVAAALEDFFECPVTFDSQEHELHLDRGILTKPLPEADSDALQNFLALIRRQLDALDSPLESLVNLIETRLGRGAFDQATLKTALGVSRRAFQRQLQSHGTSYSELLARARHSLSLR